MVRIEKDLTNKKQTGEDMYWLVNTFFTDLDTYIICGYPCSSFKLLDWFNIVRKIPYKIDTKPIEVIARPKILLDNCMKGLDCKKKAILIASWLKCNDIEYRFMTSSRRPDKKIHHVFPQGFINDRWMNLDATYSTYRPFDEKIVTNAEVL